MKENLSTACKRQRQLITQREENTKAVANSLTLCPVSSLLVDYDLYPIVHELWRCKS